MGYILVSVSLLTLTAISVDRLLALLLKLKYRQVVTLRKTLMTVICFWVVSTVAATMYFWNSVIMLWYGTVGLFLCLITSILSYTKIFVKPGNQQTQAGARSCSPTEPKHSTEHIVIQKGSVHYIVVSVDIFGLFFTKWHSANADDSK